MVIAYDEDTITQYMKQAVEYSQDRPILIDKFLEDAIEVDVDALSDGEDVVIGASCSTSRKPASTLATPPACCPRLIFPVAARSHARLHLPVGACLESDRLDERAVRHSAQIVRRWRC